MNRLASLLLTLLLIFFINAPAHALNHENVNNKKIERIALLDKNNCIKHHYTLAWTYDALHRLTCLEQEVESAHPKKTLYFYNESGLIEKVTKPDSVSMHYQYDSSQRLQRMYASDRTVDYEYDYDDLNRPITFIDHIHGLTLSRHYNTWNEITKEASNCGISIENDYDSFGRRTSMTLPDHSQILYHYDEALLTSIKRMTKDNKLSYEHTYIYDEQGRVIESTLPDQAGNLNFYYDDSNQVQTILSPWWSETLMREDVSAPHRISNSTIQDPLGLANHLYRYTEDGQLASEDGNFNHQYEYDNLFNRITYDEKEWGINEANQITHTPHLSYQYDKNGNQIEKKTDSTHFLYEYDALNRLTKVIKDNKTAFEYVYDPFNRRLIQKLFEWNSFENNWEQIKADYFIYDDNKEIGKMNAAGHIEELRILGLNRGSETGAAIAVEIKDHIYIPIHDHQGSICCLINKQTKKVDEFYRYSAYGEELIFDSAGNQIEESIVGNPWRFAAKRHDSMSELIFFGRRYYDPLKGCWTTPDPLFMCDTPNLYTFVRNDPINHQDLYGLFSFYNGWECITNATHALYQRLIQSNINKKGENGERLLDETMQFSMEDSNCGFLTGIYGKGDVYEKTRITFINGILTTYDTLMENVQLISDSHGGMNVHYVFRPTEGWISDIKSAATIKLAYQFGFRSIYCHMLVKMWKNLIKEMGGSEGGGVIIHYAHSLGGSDTDRARDLLTPEEQKMIRIITFGSVTLIRNQGYQNVTHYMSVNDALRFLDPTGLARNWFDPYSNIIWKDQLKLIMLPIDHFFAGPTYHSILIELGNQFLAEFAH